jgi:hypothetical protein
VIVNLIIAGIFVLVLALMLVRWKRARVVLTRSLAAPLRTTVIKIKSSQGEHAKQSLNDNRKARESVAVNN